MIVARMEQIIKRLHCNLFGHKRGKRTGIFGAYTLAGHVEYQCRRCKATWSRKVKAA